MIANILIWSFIGIYALAFLGLVTEYTVKGLAILWEDPKQALGVAAAYALFGVCAIAVLAAGAGFIALWAS